jgi:hypothetical protein
MAKKPTNPLLNPAPAVLIKVASAAVHAQEFLEPDGHAFDKSAFDDCMNDPAVREWLAAMTKAAYLPVKRSAR